MEQDENIRKAQIGRKIVAALLIFACAIAFLIVSFVIGYFALNFKLAAEEQKILEQYNAKIYEYDLVCDKVDYSCVQAVTTTSSRYIDDKFFDENGFTIPEKATVILDKRYSNELDGALEDYNSGKYTGVTNAYGYTVYTDNFGSISDRTREELIYLKFTCDSRLELYEDIEFDKNNVIDNYKYASIGDVIYVTDGYDMMMLEITIEFAEGNTLSDSTKNQIAIQTKQDILLSLLDNILRFDYYFA